MYLRKKMEMYFFTPLKFRFVEANFYFAFILFMLINLLIVLYEYIEFSDGGVNYKVMEGAVAYVDGKEFGLFGVGGYRFKLCLDGMIKKEDRLSIKFVDDFKNKKILFESKISPVVISANGMSICKSGVTSNDVVAGKKSFIIVYLLIMIISIYGYIGFCKRIKEIN